jgi:hypothetical protein
MLLRDAFKENREPKFSDFKFYKDLKVEELFNLKA